MKIVQPVQGAKGTELFWKTLAQHRNTPHYQMLRRQIAELGQRKMSGLPTSHRDKPFTKKSGGELAGIWHMALSRSPDIVLFYTIEENEMNFVMLGSHHDYPNAGKNMSAASRTARRIRNALEKGAVTSPQWSEIDWRDIDFLLKSTELYEASKQALAKLIVEVEQEMATGELYERRHGVACTELPEEEFMAYLDELETLHSRCYEVLRMKPLTSEEFLGRLEEMALAV